MPLIWRLLRHNPGSYSWKRCDMWHVISKSEQRPTCILFMCGSQGCDGTAVSFKSMTLRFMWHVGRNQVIELRYGLWITTCDRANPITMPARRGPRLSRSPRQWSVVTRSHLLTIFGHYSQDSGYVYARQLTNWVQSTKDYEIDQLHYDPRRFATYPVPSLPADKLILILVDI